MFLSTILYSVKLQVAHDCADILASGQHNSGVYTVRVNGNNLEVYCEMTTEGGGWLVITTTLYTFIFTL